MRWGLSSFRNNAEHNRKNKQCGREATFRGSLPPKLNLGSHCDKIAASRGFRACVLTSKLKAHRLNRTLEKAKAELKQLQKERAESREKALIDAGEIANLKEALRQPWNPRDDGFEFSAEDLAAWLRSRELNNAALIFRIEGCLPAQPAGSCKKGVPHTPASH
ncbi:MAG TPA: hypothetical protein VIY49_18830 [Bryobacteraceae bacterium]